MGLEAFLVLSHPLPSEGINVPGPRAAGGDTTEYTIIKEKMTHDREQR